MRASVPLARAPLRQTAPKRTDSCPNGDRLADLNMEKALAQERLQAARDELSAEVEKLRPFHEAEAAAQREVDNLSARLHVWWHWYRIAGGK